VLFIDEIHRIARPAEEMLYMAMEDFRVDVWSARARAPPRSRSTSPPFTLVGATTRAGLLPGPLRGPVRLRRAHMDFYEPASLA
jgi:Holliday junction DNA helicase RuvB